MKESSTRDGAAPEARVTAVQVRAHGEAIPARFEAPATVWFDAPQRGIAPGQLVAFFDGDEVVGGANIARALR